MFTYPPPPRKLQNKLGCSRQVIQAILILAGSAWTASTLVCSTQVGSYLSANIRLD
jgi:hypothetical protein